MSTVFETALKGKHIVIVGGSSVMGKATAKMATALGAKITIASRSAAKLHAAADEIGGGVHGPAIRPRFNGKHLQNQLK